MENLPFTPIFHTAHYTSGTMPVDVLPDELLRSTLRRVDGITLLLAGASCTRWRAVTDDDGPNTNLWKELCVLHWPELANLQNVNSYKQLWARMGKLDMLWSDPFRRRLVSPWSPPAHPPQLQFCVRLIGRRPPFKGRMLLAHMFDFSEVDTLGEFRCPPLTLSDDELLLRANDNYPILSLDGILDGCRLMLWAVRADGKMCCLLHGGESPQDEDAEIGLVKFCDTWGAEGHGGMDLGHPLAVEATFGTRSTSDPLILDGQELEEDDGTSQWALDVVKPLRDDVKMRLTWCWTEDGPEMNTPDDFVLAMLHCPYWI